MQLLDLLRHAMFVADNTQNNDCSKGAGSFHTHRKTMKELGALAVLGVREQPNLAQNLVTHRH